MRYYSRNGFLFFISVSIFFVIAISSGFRNGGFDYFEYINMIDILQKHSSFWGQIIMAKDPFFGFVVYIFSPMSDSNDYVKVFLLFSFLAFFCNVFVLSKLANPFVYSIIYAIFFAPALNFAAMRAMLAIMFFLVFIYCKAERLYVLSFIFCCLSIASHISMLLPVILSLDSIYNKWRGGSYFYGITFFIVSIFSSYFFLLFKSAHDYVGHGGTVFAFIPPILTLVSSLIFSKVVRYPCDDDCAAKCLYRVSIFLFVMSIGFAFTNVIASSRFLQIGQVTYLTYMCSGFYKKSHNNIIIVFISFFIFLTPLIYRNISFHLWDAMWSAM